MIKTVRLIALLSFLSFGMIFTGSAENSVNIISIQGDVKVLPDGKSDWIKAGLTMVLRKGDRIRTGSESECVIGFDRENRNVVGVRENSDVVMLLSSEQQIELIDARIFARLSAIPKGTKFEIKTPTAICGARGTGLGVDGNNAGTRATAFQNSIYLGNGGGDQEDIGEGFSRFVDSQGNISEEMEADGGTRDRFNAWSRNIDNLISLQGGQNTNKMDNLSQRSERIADMTDAVAEKEDDKKIDAREERGTETREDSGGGTGGGTYTKG